MSRLISSAKCSTTEQAGLPAASRWISKLPKSDSSEGVEDGGTGEAIVKKNINVEALCQAPLFWFDKRSYIARAQHAITIQPKTYRPLH